MMYFRHLYDSFILDIWSIPWRMSTLVFLVFLAIFPFVITDQYILRVMTFTCLFAIFAASWDFIGGFTGQFNLGHAAFFGIGAYTAAISSINLSLPPFFSILLGATVSVIGGLLICMPALRLRGFYLALVTMAFPVVLTGLLYVFPKLTGAELGISGVQRISSSPLSNYYTTFVIMTLSLFTMWKLMDNQSRIVRTGVIFRAIREDEITARASGIKTTQYKILAFCISGFFAGLAGALYAHLMGITGPSTLSIMWSFNPIVWTIFGGISTIYGPVVGVFILNTLIEFLRFSSFGEVIRLVIQAILLIIVILYMPEGITTWIRDHTEKRCLRCKNLNIITRSTCRICGAELHLKSHALLNKEE
jgi:branched-chain amino acid transport system permease protein